MTNTHVLNGVGTRDPSNQAEADLRLRPHCHQDRLRMAYRIIKEYIYLRLDTTGARGGIVVKALRYKPAGRGFDSPWCQDFSP